MYDNKVRLSQDVIEKAELIAAEWGLKNARAAVEAVFRKYADDYLHGRQPANISSPSFMLDRHTQIPTANQGDTPGCAALDELDDLLGM